MKNVKFYLSLASISLCLGMLAGCGGSKKKMPIGIENDSGLPTEITYVDEPAIQIHYQRDEGSYLPWGLWIWAEGMEGAEYEFNYADDYGVIAYYPLTRFNNARNLGFIVKELFSYAGDGVWNKDINSDRFMDLDMLKIDSKQCYHVYLCNGKAAVYTDPYRTHVMDAVKTCQFEDYKKITLATNNAMKSIKMYKDGQLFKDYSVSGGNKNKTITLNNNMNIESEYYINVVFDSGSKVDKNISIRKLYNSDFDAKYNYDGELGAIYTKANTTFKVWSPVSSSIKLRIYDNGTPTSVDATKGNDTYQEYSMSKDAKGVFSYTVSGDLEGKYYTYFVTNSYNSNGKEIVDPYAKSAGINGRRGMVVDFSKTNPDGWDSFSPQAYDRTALTVYETHVADMTSSETWTGTEANRLKYAGMHESGTTYTEKVNGVDVKVSTGFDHIKELGVNAVQIIPFFDQDNKEVNTPFNWGYNPLNYNVVEGCYSSNPYDGYVRIRELKEMIKAYGDENINIIMDVVYNHVSGIAGSNFDTLMPYYYFRYNNDGSASSGSGCGNDTASERYMFHRFMIDSAVFWAKEYKLGGFRFDLMGLHDLATMNELVAECQKINPDIVIYGEPWQMSTAVPSGTVMANQGNASKFVGFGQFNDKLRDSMVKSGMNTKGNKGWITQTAYATDASSVAIGMKGETQGCTKDPYQTVTYVTCHDNYTIHDRAVAAGIHDEEEIAKMNVLANSVVFTSQGTTFMLAGEEMLRTKIVYDNDGNPVYAKDEEGNPTEYYEVSENSYSSPYKTNEINYSWKVHHLDMFENYKDLIAFKQSCEGLHYNKEKAQAETVITLSGGSVAMAKVRDDNYEYRIYHANGSLANDMSLDVADNEEVIINTLGEAISEGTILLKAFGSIVIKSPLFD